MTFETLDIQIKSLKRNTGQIPGVPKNPRIIKDNNFKKLKDSIVQDPEMLELREIIAYKQGDDYIIIGGNMRFEALKALNFEKAKCKVITGETTPEQLKRIILKDNSAYGEWDFDELANEWEESLLTACAIEIPTMDEAKMEEEAEEDNFNPDDIGQEPTVKRGEIWQLGNHRLLCGDSTKAEDVARLMNGEQADLWLTDPPYNCGYGVEENKTREQQDHHKPIENDKMDDAEYQQFLLNVFKCASDNMREGAAYYIWYSDKEHSKYQLALSQLGIPYKAMLIWNKNTFVLSFNDYKQKHEVCLYGWKPGVKHYFVDKRNLTSVYEDVEELDIDKMKKSEMQKLLHDIFDNPTPTTVINEKKPVRSEAHPTMKPVRLFGYQIANSSRPGNIILDTFGGSGTTIVAAEQLNRRARLMELDPHYCDVIIARWEKLTGREAVKIGNLP